MRRVDGSKIAENRESTTLTSNLLVQVNDESGGAWTLATEPPPTSVCAALSRNSDHPLLLRLLLLCIVLWPALLRVASAIEPIPQAADVVTVVNANSQAEIRLDANLYIPDGGELLLSIDVPREQIRVDSKGPAKVTRVYSDRADGQWGFGEEIYFLVLRTGSHTSSCHRREIQRLRCLATAGTFSVGFVGQRVYNIPYNANQRMLRAYLTCMTKIDQVQVEYSIDEDAACTFFGNNITITFESVNTDGNDGDLPELAADVSNVGGDGTKLDHIRYSPAIATQAWETQKGNDVPDHVAAFPGDASSRLEYVNSDSLMLLSSAAIVTVDAATQQVPANAKLPPPGSKGDWKSGMGSSLSAFHALVIDVLPPRVISATSPHNGGTFGIGEAILIHVHFSLPIVVSWSPTLVSLTESSLDLFSGEFVVAAPIGSNSPKTIRFPAVNHGLTTATNKGLQFEIDGQLLTIDSVNGDDVAMLEVYTGTVVNPTIVALGVGPNVQIFMPGYRPAAYARGSGTSTLVFCYDVQRGDVPLDLECTSTSSLRINSGSAIKQLSTTPATDADVTLAAPGTATSLGSTSAIVINTGPPHGFGSNQIDF
ncbi:hypothetical protein FI667_g1876, partial [Globisporangium splendens]